MSHRFFTSGLLAAVCTIKLLLFVLLVGTERAAAVTEARRRQKSVAGYQQVRARSDMWSGAASPHRFWNCAATGDATLVACVFIRHNQLAGAPGLCCILPWTTRSG